MKLKSKKKLVLISILILIICLMIFSTIKGFTDKSKPKKDKVETYTVQKEDSITLSGKTKPEKSKKYNKEDIGQYYNILVKNGEHVQQGEKIINLNNNTTQRQTLVNNVFKQQESVNNIYKSISTNGANNQLNNQLSEKLSSLNQAKNQLTSYDNKVYESTHALFNGVVDVEESKDNILELLSLNSNIEVKVNELEIDKIKEGDTVNIDIKKSGKSTTGKIIYISQSPLSSDKVGNANSLSEYKVIIGDIKSEVRDGSSTVVSIPLNTLIIPQTFLNKDHTVFVLDKNSIARKRKIKFKKQGKEIKVTKGLKEGEKIIYREKPFNDGEKVEVSK